MIKLMLGDCQEMMRGMDAGSVHCCVTSPPYFGLRDYGVEGQIGLEATPEAYVARMVDVFREVRRVLRDDGTLWLNLGDSYLSGKGMAGGANKFAEGTHTVDPKQPARRFGLRPVDRPILGLKSKDLIGIPWRVAFALQADGWYLRSDIIWHKPNPMRESVRDRPTKSHEYLFLLTKSDRYFYDADATKEPISPKTLTVKTTPRKGKGTESTGEKLNLWMEQNGGRYHPEDRNMRSVWTVATKPFPEAHFATFPPKLIEPCILAGTSGGGCCAACSSPRLRIVDRYRTRNGKRCDDLGAWRNTDPGSPIGAQGDGHWRYGSTSETKGWGSSCSCSEQSSVPCTVMDPFGGAGTVGVVAKQHGRSYVGIELKPEYLEMSRKRIDETRVEMPLFNAPKRVLKPALSH